MLTLNDIFRHYGRRKTLDVLVRVSTGREIPNNGLPILEDLAYIELVRRGAGTDLELTDAGTAVLARLESEVGSLMLQE